MIDFIFSFKHFCNLWQKKPSTLYTIKDISEQLEIELPYLVKYLSEAEVIPIELDEKINFKKAKKALIILTQKYNLSLKKREEAKRKEAEEIQIAYQRLLTKTNRLQSLNEWENAFRNLRYFAGEHEKKLPKEIFINLCSDIVRSGIKSKNTNLQEVSLWLRKAVEKNLEEYDQESLEDALDLIETYSSYFVREETSGKGKRALIDILALIENPACELQLWQSYKQCADNIFFNSNE